VEASAQTVSPADNKLAPGTTMVLVAMALGVLVIANDFTALNVALPSIEHDLNADIGTVQWVINAYTLTFGMAIVTGGRLADLFGRRKVFFIGSAFFAVFSLAGAAAQGTGWLIGARVGMGIGGALMWPAILGMTFAALPESKAGFAGALILGCAGVGNALGPLIGGALSEASWRWIFVLNVPIAALAVWVTWLKVHQPAVDAGERRIDYAGIACLSLGLLLLLLGMDQAADWGFGDPRVVGMFVVAAVLIVTFGFIEPRRGEVALIPRDIVRNFDFSAACLTVLMMSAIFFASVLYVPQLMQKVLNYSPLASGVGMLPMLALFAGVAFLSGRLYDRLGPKVVITAGALGLTAGPFAISLFQADSGYLVLVPGLVLLGIGAGLFYPSVTTAAVTALDPSRSSLAGGLVYMFQIAGGAIGLGLATTVFTTKSEGDVGADAAHVGIHLSDAQTAVVHGSLAGTDSGMEVIHQFPHSAAKLMQVVEGSFVSGVQTAFYVIGGIAVAGLVISVLFVGGRLFGGPAGGEATEAIPAAETG
jgi:EmrB/QacA subfamily drug resistance transporter